MLLRGVPGLPRGIQAPTDLDACAGWFECEMFQLLLESVHVLEK